MQLLLYKPLNNQNVPIVQWFTKYYSRYILCSTKKKKAIKSDRQCRQVNHTKLHLIWLILIADFL